MSLIQTEMRQSLLTLTLMMSSSSSSRMPLVTVGCHTTCKCHMQRQLEQRAGLACSEVTWRRKLCLHSRSARPVADQLYWHARRAQSTTGGCCVGRAISVSIPMLTYMYASPLQMGTGATCKLRSALMLMDSLSTVCHTQMAML